MLHTFGACAMVCEKPIDAIAPALRCLVCDYDLRGLPEPRCPECGTAFDPHPQNELPPSLTPPELAGKLVIGIGVVWAVIAWMLSWLDPVCAMFLAPSYVFVGAVPGWGISARMFVLLAAGQFLFFSLPEMRQVIPDNGLAILCALIIPPGLSIACATSFKQSSWLAQIARTHAATRQSGRWVFHWQRGSAVVIAVIVLTVLWTCRNRPSGTYGVPYWPAALLACAAILGFRRPRARWRFGKRETFWAALCVTSVLATLVWLGLCREYVAWPYRTFVF